MIRRTFTRDSGGGPGTWRPLYVGRGEGARSSATVCCPGCSREGALADHTIADDGLVSPSLVCPHDCGFHEHARLEGWPP